jgi:hypothetical protein
MVVQVKDALAGIGSGIDDDAKAGFSDTMLARQARRDTEDLSDERVVVGFDIENARDMFARNNENMHWRPGSDVLEGNHGIVAIDDACLSPSLYNAAKQAVIHRIFLENSSEANQSVFVGRAGKTCKDQSVFDLYRNGLKGKSHAGTPNAFSGRRLEHRAVSGAHKVAIIDTEELVIHPV